jgi:transcriptional regulator with XRE-family HTH domain
MNEGQELQRLAKMIRSVRLRSGLTQIELERRSRVCRSSIYFWESGHSFPCLRALQRLLAALPTPLELRVVGQLEGYSLGEYLAYYTANFLDLSDREIEKTTGVCFYPRKKIHAGEISNSRTLIKYIKALGLNYGFYRARNAVDLQPIEIVDIEIEKKRIAKMLRIVLKRSGLSYKEISRRAGIKQEKSIHSWGTGQFLPKLDSLQKVLESLPTPLELRVVGQEEGARIHEYLHSYYKESFDSDWRTLFCASDLSAQTIYRINKGEPTTLVSIMKYAKALGLNYGFFAKNDRPQDGAIAA